MEAETQAPEFWKDQERATAASQKIAFLKEEIETIESLKKELIDLKELEYLTKSDENLKKELEKKWSVLKEKIAKEEFRIFLSGKYDRNNAIIEIFSGAGGVDAQDWATMLLRMYERYCAQKRFSVQVLHQSFGEAGGPDGRIGTKSATLEIKGKYAYGLLKKETGVHRLVRISPFSAQKLRHTSFALVEVLPEIEQQDTEIEIKPEELKIDTFRASGPGGQYVNKTESAIRITHIPTGLVVSSQSERLQGKNKEHAMKILYAKLHQLQAVEHKKELKEIKGESISASWGTQIRSYVLHPYRMVKDLRTQYETSDTEGVLDGELDEFIQAEIRI
ncbi:MAG: peptide chain release factor 2 [Candidatus Staskawiczbacteria bacterium RIFCSPLOWO2_02_FULL_39_8]|nr:MAG: peptide chain release factor 2 [Candidatus Staskawiczbacteria bacterium RIFCSPLOWO2_02_FULL_39_8]